MNSEYIVCLQNFDKFFFDIRMPKGPLPWDANFSMDKIFSTFVFFVMRTHMDSGYIVSLENINTLCEKTVQKESNKTKVNGCAAYRHFLMCNCQIGPIRHTPLDQL